ncbi:glycosyltransferase [Pseudodesulfovibrio cashew]|uniref:Glycosyltransferase n=1 Tax=Pseudodesulfovibrio cashew TaxID=2678688 RepID=A0A6I6JKJ8_9BACT|nr:glycosyltransferase [Pseudodesulfovibrio cashew]QGY40832.1 glycosyltransferase [Pseudodesulfovibrio cashew]
MTDGTYRATERFGELELIGLDSVFTALEVYCDNLLPDLEACLVFLSRILRDRDAAAHPRTREWVTLLARKLRDLGPFHPQGLELVHKLTGDPALDARLERMRYFTLEPQLMDLRGVMSDPGVMRRKRTLLTETLDRMPAHVLAASQLLQLEFYQGVNQPEWLGSFTPPKFFRQEWTQRLFLHYAGLGDAERAMPIWSEVAAMPLSEVQLNLAAECFVKCGETEQAMACYRESLRLDPHQTPVRLRMAELEQPSRADNALVHQSKVAVCLYSWNKAEDLERTLAGLAETDLGPAIVRVLLNGCTDHSAEVAEAARVLFPDNDYDIITLPVNIGAPAARNWLGALPEVRACDFLAYLDDDVELPADWLAHFLTVMRRYPDTSAVGAKVVFGSEPRMIQYIYRSFAVAEPEIIKLTDPCQVGQFDAGHYDFVRETDAVMGCCHLLRMAHLPDGPQFDVRYSPSQVDDTAHDIRLRLQGGEVRYCGLVKCVHHQNTGGGFKRQLDAARIGQVHGNDMKFQAWLAAQREKVERLMRKSGK